MKRYARLLPVFAIAFAFVAVAGSLPSEKADAATSGSCGDGVAWSFEGDTLSITYTGAGTGRMDDHDDPTEFEYASLWESIDNVVIGEGVTYIGKTAFRGFGIDSITLSSTVEEIGQFSIQGSEITSVDLKNVVTIGRGAFYESKLLTGVVIPSTVETIGDYAFDLCISLASVDTSEATSLVTIGRSAFVASAIKDFYVPATVTSLGTGAFVECYSLQSIDVDPANAKYVDVDGVVYDIDMKTVLHYPPAKAVPSYEIPGTVTSIGPAAFATGSKIGAVTIPDSVTVIGNNAFEKCVGLTSIKIPNTVTSIGEFAFNSCERIETIDFSGTTVLRSIGNGAFLDNIKLKTVEIPACVESLGERAFAACSTLETISIDPSNEHYTTVDGILYDKKMETLMQFPGGCKMTSFTVPSTVKKIDVNAFSNLTVLESLTFPDSVTTISDGACTSPSYQQSPLLKISFGKGLTTITGDHPFIAHTFLDKDGNKLQQTVGNLKGHTFVGEDVAHMYMEDGKSSEGFPLWAIAAIAIAILAVAVGLVLWKRSR